MSELLLRKRSFSIRSQEMQPSHGTTNDLPREAKSAPCRNARYESVLAIKSAFTDEPDTAVKLSTRTFPVIHFFAMIFSKVFIIRSETKMKPRSSGISLGWLFFCGKLWYLRGARIQFEHSERKSQFLVAKTPSLIHNLIIPSDSNHRQLQMINLKNSVHFSTNIWSKQFSVMTREDMYYTSFF